MKDKELIERIIALHRGPISIRTVYALLLSRDILRPAEELDRALQEALRLLEAEGKIVVDGEWIFRREA